MTKRQVIGLGAIVLAGSFTAANVAYAAPVAAQMRDGQSVHGVLETRLLNQVSDRYPGQTIVAADFERGDIVSRGTGGELHVIPFNPETLTLRQ